MNQDKCSVCNQLREIHVQCDKCNAGVCRKCSIKNYKWECPKCDNKLPGKNKDNKNGKS